MPAKVIPDSKVRRLYRQGLGPTEITRVLAEEDNINVCPEAISMWRFRRGDPSTKARYRDLIPWRIKTEHMNRHPVKMLRAEARRRAGKPLCPKDRQALERWITRRTADGTVVDYDPLSGWRYVQRRPGIDSDLIRQPDA